MSATTREYDGYGSHGWTRARTEELVIAAEADRAVPEAQFFDRMLSPADWTLDDVRPDDASDLGGES